LTEITPWAASHFPGARKAVFETKICLQKMFLSENPAQSFFVGIVTSQVQETESRSNKERRKQRGVVTKSASRGQHVGFVVMSADTFGKF